MLINYIKTAYRNLIRNKLFALINVVGLAIGIASCLFLFIYVHHEFSYDNFHENQENIYRLSSSWVGDNSNERMAVTAPNIGPYLKDNYAEIVDYARLFLIGKDPEIKIENRIINESNFFQSDRNILNVFTFYFLYGTPESFSNIGDVVISETTALKLFGRVDCIGYVFELNESTVLIKGIYKDFPTNSDLKVNGLSYQNFDSFDNWEMFAFYTYLLKNDNTDQVRLDSILLDVSNKHYHKNAGIEEAILLESQALTDLHFSDSIIGDSPKGNLNYVYMYLLSGILLLLIIIINLTNIGTLKVVEKLKEIATRKLLGANEWHIINQFIVENVLVIFVGGALSMTIFQLLLSDFNSISGLQIQLVEDYEVIMVVFLIEIMAISFFSLYPIYFALIPEPINALSGQFSIEISGSSLRKYLVLFQLIISGILVFTLSVFYYQWDYMSHKDLGFIQKGIVNLEIPNDFNYKLHTFINDIEKISGVENISTGGWGALPGSETPFTTASIMSKIPQEIIVNSFSIDENYTDILELKLKSGKDFTSMPLGERDNLVIVNEALLRNSISEDENSIIGKNIGLVWKPDAKVIGVVKDYNYRSLHNEINPLILTYESFNTLNTETEYRPKVILIKGVDVSLLEIEDLWKSHFSGVIPKISFLEEKLGHQYNKEQEAIGLIGYFALISIIIAGLGIFGIISYVLESRIFEIGIRKILGADNNDLILLFGKEMTMQFALALIITLICGIYLKSKILEMYAFQATIQLWNLIGPVLIPYFIALIVIIFRINIKSNVNITNLIRH